MSDNVQFMEGEAPKAKRGGGHRRSKAKPKKAEPQTVDAAPVEESEEVSDFTMEDVQPIAVQEDPADEVPLQLPAIASTSEALQAILLAFSGEQPDEWDELIASSEEVAPSVRTERLTLGEGGYYYRDEERKKKLFAAELVGLVLAYTEPRNDFLGDGSENLPPFCASPDGVWGKVSLPEDEDEREALLELAEDEDTPHPLLRIREHTGQDVREWSGKCKECPRSKWRSANGESRGQACKQMRRLLFLPDGADGTVAVHLPPTSIGIWDKWAAERANRKDRAYYFCRVKLGSRVESAGAYTWGKVTLENLGRISLTDEKGKEDRVKTMALAKAIVNFQAAARAELAQMAAKGEDYFV